MNGNEGRIGARPRRSRVWRLATAALILTTVTGCTFESEPRADGATPTPAPPVEYHAPTPATEGWIAFAAGGFPDTDIMLVLPGEPAHRIIGSDDDGIAEACPAFAPGSSRLAFGEATGDHEDGWANAALVIADVTAGEAPLWWRIGLGDLKHMPCPIWSPEGRWIAFGADQNFTGGGNEFRIVDGVQLFDTATEEIRRLTDLDATDIEWAPDGSGLYIADQRGILVYSLADAQTRTLPDTPLTRSLAVSPDGQRLVTERRRMNSAGRYDLWLMNADGSDPRILVEEYVAGHGLGPVWSPDGRRVVFQRACDTLTDESGNSRDCTEESDVVLVTVDEADPAAPIGTQQVIPFPQTVAGGEARFWTPYSVTWSPDGTSLLYLGWGATDIEYEHGSVDGLLSVSVSDQTPPVVLYESPAPGYSDMGVYMAFPMNNFQSWTAAQP